MMVQYSKAEPIEKVMTFSEWEKIHNRREERKQAEKSYFRKQKALGIFALVTTAAEFILGYTGMIDEGGAFIFLLPIGIYALVTKNKICNF